MGRKESNQKSSTLALSHHISHSTMLLKIFCLFMLQVCTQRNGLNESTQKKLKCKADHFSRQKVG